MTRALLAVALALAPSVVSAGVQAAPDKPCPVEMGLFDWPVAEACAVSFCESRWLDDVGETNRGQFQIWVGWADYYGIPRAALYDRRTNVAIAYLVWRHHGRWSAWACQP